MVGAFLQCCRICVPVRVPYLAMALSVGGENVEGQGVTKGLCISEVDDGFFNLFNMERYLDQAEQLSDPGIESCLVF